MLKLFILVEKTSICSYKVKILTKKVAPHQVRPLVHNRLTFLKRFVIFPTYRLI